MATIVPWSGECLAQDVRIDAPKANGGAVNGDHGYLVAIALAQRRVRVDVDGLDLRRLAHRIDNLRGLIAEVTTGAGVQDHTARHLVRIGRGYHCRVSDPDAPTPGATSVAAFFDVDNTIIRGASPFHMARGLHARGYFRWRDLVRFAFEAAKYQLFGETQNQMDELRKNAGAIVRGWSVAEMAAIGEEVWDEVLATRVYPGTKAIIDDHLARGHQVWLVSASPVEIPRLIARKMGATGALGTVGEHVDGHYTGKFVGGLMHGPRKGEALRELAAESGLDLARCYAYGDSANDVHMLDAVGHPCAINPDSKLQRLAKERGWPMKEFRKRRKNGRRGIVKASITGGVWVILVVTRGIRRALCSPFRR